MGYNEQEAEKSKLDYYVAKCKKGEDEDAKMCEMAEFKMGCMDEEVMEKMPKEMQMKLKRMMEESKMDKECMQEDEQKYMKKEEMSDMMMKCKENFEKMDEEMQKKCKSLMLKVQMMKAKEMCMSEEKDERMQKMCEMDEEDEDDEEDKVDREMLGVQMRACKQEAMKD